MNADLIQTFQAKPTNSQKVEPVCYLFPYKYQILFFYFKSSILNLMIVLILQSVQMKDILIFVYGVKHNLIVMYQILEKKSFYSVM